ncbi:MAG: DNA gyrase/topoisomerase IV subunit A [Muribaculaceae bacterium]|nr:DNA gyrase/topoisomerase IV subunit A [Muribaculaceae bacterium]
MSEEYTDPEEITPDGNEPDAESADLVPETEETAIAPGTPRPYCDPHDVIRHHLSGMFQTWFLDYASYVILERAVPNIEDGLKPVQRRILHSMKTLDDGRYNKVANIVGNTMQYHPHGDASINDALVQLGQKELLIDTQGNWGNVLTGASAAAGRYIEARLSTFALETLYNPKVTEWTWSYDGRKREPVTLPSKFPLLLAQGAEGIAVGLSSKILPHNFNELLDASIAYLRGEEFTLLPDFVTGGFIDVSRYNDGRRGGSLKVRAKIEKVDNRTLAITEIPFGRTTGAVIDSIIKAMEKGKIKVRKVDDNTSENARIVVHLQPGTSSDMAIDALYAFTDCEVSISPNCCVIVGDKPEFIGVSDVLRHSADRTMAILKAELEYELGELNNQLLFASLERIFIENRIYKDKEYEEAKDLESAKAHIYKRLEPFVKDFVRPVEDDDILRLLEIKMKRIMRFNADESDRQMTRLRERIDEVHRHLSAMVEYTIGWFERLKEKYGANHPRRTVIRGFDSIEAATVAEATEKLYINREDRFVGTGLKNGEFVCNCSNIDDIIIFYKDGRYMVCRVQDKMAVDEGVMHIAVFKRNDNRTIYNVIYRQGKTGPYMMKRFAATGLTRDKVYNIIPGNPVPAGSKVMWFSANPNGEAEVVKVILKPKRGLKKLQLDVDFANIRPKGRAAMGNLVTRNELQRLTLKSHGASTLGGLQVWFDHDVLRLNFDGRGEYLGEFTGEDRILVITRNGEFYTTTFQATNHYDDNILRIEKFEPDKVWTAILNDAEQGYPYIKRFTFEASSKVQRYLTDSDRSTLIALSDNPGAMFKVTFGADDAVREPMTVDAEEFIGLKSFKARGKRLTTYTIASVEELEPKEQSSTDDSTEISMPQEPEETAEQFEEVSDDELRDEFNGQQRLFD